MIISHKYKFIFIKTRKTAGSSIELFLSQHSDKEDIITPLYPHEKNHLPQNHRGIINPFRAYKTGFKCTIYDLMTLTKFRPHMSARAVKNRVPIKIWDNYFKFCIERNPWDKTISDYYFVKEHRYGGNLTWNQYIEYGRFVIDTPMYLDRDGNIIVDRVLRYENINEQLSEVCKMLNIPFDGLLKEKSKSTYRKDRRHYSEIFKDSEKKIIENAFRHEIDLFGYKY